MKQTLYIEIFALHLHKIKSSREVTTPSGGTGTRHNTVSEKAHFSDLFDTLQGDSSEEKLFISTILNLSRILDDSISFSTNLIKLKKGNLNR